MLRLTHRRWAPAAASTIGATYLNSSDFALQYPRFTITTHVADAGLPELKECRALYKEEPEANRKQCYALVERASDVFKNMNGWDESEAMTNVVRSVTAAKIQLAHEGKGGLVANPATSAASSQIPKLQLSLFTLRESFEALKASKWTHGDVAQIDIGCYLVGKFVESYAKLTPRRDPGSVDRDRLVPASDKPMLQTVMDQINVLLRLAAKAAETHGSHHHSLKYVPIKLTVLKAILTIALQGDLYKARDLISQACLLAESLLGGKASMLEDVTLDPITGILLLLQAEINARIFNWSHFPKEMVDEEVMLMFQRACEFYSGKFESTAANAGIMDVAVPSRANYSVPVDAETAPLDMVLREHYETCLLSYGNFLLSAPRSNPKETIFPKGESFTRNALIAIASGSDMIFDECQAAKSLPIATARKQSEAALDRALKLNRKLLPEKRHNEKAGWALLSLACCFGDLRDYLYATGLMSNATNTFRDVYGENSEEQLFLLKLEERLLNGMGSAKESETRLHKIKAIEEERLAYTR
eukprot:CAMPEP_0176459402 /NCGR_PEP_ID=MMETSP0127-20121128/33251_1 /TAXON_ID=938130 /ORGANISM="Platyophrya macrostoma, Strain WH" /LENGTH=530 /DNA_ID=CAMNT_0017850323 /DNA_START=100 /DNA_END=1692 /DNA_ORIENTATION=-